MTLRLAASNIAWEPSDDDAAAAVLREHGFAAVEIAPTKWWDKPLEAPAPEIAEQRTGWAAREVPIVAMQALLFGRPDLQLFGSPVQRDELRAYLHGIIDLAASLGVRVLVFGSPKNRRRGSLSMVEAMRVAVPFFRAIGEHAAVHRMAFCIEPNPAAYDCDFITTMDEAFELDREVSQAGFMVHADLGGMTVNGEDPGLALARAPERLGHVHVSEPYLAEIGTGGAAHERAAAALHAIGYSGWVSIEMKAAGQDRLAALSRACALVASVYGSR
jgi:sugar phosphate isomerase/epimerase